MSDISAKFERSPISPNDTELPPPALRGYKIVRQIAAGGASRVYEATQRSMERPVAIKVLRWRHAGDAQEARGFDQEVATLARLDHPNLVAIIERGQWQGQPYCVMERVEGKSLAERIRGGELTIEQLLRAIRGAAGALEALHEAGVVHRDVKPGNILVPPTGPAKLTDLGSALLLATDGPAAAPSGAIGTAGYMAPEQARDAAKATARSDIHALAATLCHALTGAPPVANGRRRAAFWRTRLATPRLERVLAKALSSDPKQRHATVAEFAREALAAFSNAWTKRPERLVSDALLPAWLRPAVFSSLALAVVAAGLIWRIA